MRQDVGRAGGAARTLRRVFGMTAIALVLSFIDAGVALAYTPPAWWQDGAAFAKKLNPDADCSLTTNDQGYTETGDKACYVDHVPYQGGLVSGGCDVGGYPDSGPLSVWCYFDMGSGQITDETCGRDGEASTEWRNEQGGGGAAIRAFTTFDKCAEAALSAARGDDAVPKPACSDGRDNDGDGKVDLGDPGCMDATDTDEADSPLRAIKTLKIIVDGPGTVQGGGGVCNRSVCEWKYRQGTTVLLSAVGVEPTNLAFRGWGGPSCVVQGSYCQVVLTSDSTVTARFDPVRTYAPEVMLHGDEKFFPGDPAEFLKASRLFWFDDKPTRSYEPCDDHKSDRILVRTHPTASTIKSSKRPYTHRFCWGEGTQLRTKTRIFKSSALTAPAAKGDKRKFSPRRSGFYLDVRRRKKHGKTVPASQDPALYGHKPSAKSSYDTRPAMYYEYKPGKHIVYWFFFPYNSRKGDTHQGDWEHMVVRLDQTNVATQAAYYTHYCSGDIHDWTEIKSLADPLAGQHPPVYIALGGHGAWLTQGSTVLPCGNPKKGVYDRRNGRGTVWQPWLDDFGLLPAASQPWYDMGVGWGREGGLGWGPVGPGKYKTKVLPRGW